MPRRIANALTLLSAVVCVGSALLVGRSLFRMDSVYVPIAHDHGGLAATANGTVTPLHVREPRRTPRAPWISRSAHHATNPNMVLLLE